MKTIASIPTDKLVYIDESGMNDNDFYAYAYTSIGKRYYQAKPGHHKKRISMMGALCNKQFQAPFMFEGHCNTATFELYVEKVLVPTLPSGMTVVIDNASFHQSAKVKKLLSDAACQLIFLPPYSPDFNPIENWWNKIKNQIRKQMRNTKTLLQEAMQSILKKISIC